MRSATDVISWLETNLSMHLTMTDVSATGRESLTCLAPVLFFIFFMSTGIIVDIFQERGMKWISKSHWKQRVKKGPSWSEQTFKTRPRMPSGPGTSFGLTRERHLTTSLSTSVTGSESVDWHSFPHSPLIRSVLFVQSNWKGTRIVRDQRLFLLISTHLHV